MVRGGEIAARLTPTRQSTAARAPGYGPGTARRTPLGMHPRWLNSRAGSPVDDPFCLPQTGLASPWGREPIQPDPLRGSLHWDLPMSLASVIVELGHGANEVPDRRMNCAVASNIVSARLREELELRTHACDFADLNKYSPEKDPSIAANWPATHTRVNRLRIGMTVVKALIRACPIRQRWNAEGSRVRFPD